MESGEEVHQKITKESEKVWADIPDEIKTHLQNDIRTNTRVFFVRPQDQSYTLGDDVISGSAEEDVPITDTPTHFWNPDITNGGNYRYGLFSIISTSSYRKARLYWLNYVIPYYQQGDIDRSYYWLGRVAHLLEDATVPAHVHLDNHLPVGGNEDTLEAYTATIFSTFNGNNAGNFYQYENLTNMQNFNWADVDSRYKDSIYLFRLFWYTAQKTQYFASNDGEGNDTYLQITGGNPIAFLPTLWDGETVTLINRSSDVENDIDKIADAVVPHAMRATAALFRLFWDEVNIDWPFFHHTLYRTGVTALKGDYRVNNIENVNIILNNADNFVSRIVIADTDGNGLQEAIVATGKQNVGGNVYSVERNGHDQTRIKWSYNSGRTIGSPAVGNLDSNLQKEVLYATADDGKVWKLDVDASGNSVTRSQFYTLPSKIDPEISFFTRFQGDTKDVAIADLDNDGNKEVIFADYRSSNSPQWNGQLFVTNKFGSLRTPRYSIGNGGANGGVSIANVDNDARLEIIVPSSYGIKVLNYGLGSITEKWSNTHGAILGSAAVYDFGDGDLKLIYTTTASSTICDPTKTCSNTLYIVRAEDGSLNKSIDLGSLDSQVTPTVADLDNDNVPEVVIVAKNSQSTSLGSIRAYDAKTGSLEWSYTDGGNLLVSQISPDLVDMNGDGDLEVVYAENDGSKVHILTGSGNQWATYSFSGLIGSALAIGDLDNDRKAEIAVKHAGSADVDTTELSSLTDENNVPDLNRTENLTYDEGDTIDLTPFVNASDFNNDPVEIIYEAPFDNPGKWKADCQTVGNYTFFVEAADPMNLSDIQDFNVEIRPTCPVHEPIDEVTGIEGETINITVNASDPQSGTLSYVINDSRFTQENNIFRWATQNGDEGELIVNINVSDGNPLHVDSFDVKVIVFDRAATLLDTFNDSKTDDLLVFNTPGEQKSVSIRLKKNAEVVYSTITLEGLPP